MSPEERKAKQINNHVRNPENNQRNSKQKMVLWMILLSVQNREF